MPVLATRLSGGPSAEPEPRGPVIARLAAEFLTLPLDAVDRCVADVWACAEHMGLDVTPEIVERVAREHLLGVVNSTPPTRTKART
ncbi:hypothetical protein N5079_12905 [Planotetraspora sp. A-T 1434]|uniref:hypothetical protein n=1 Tax=Planotetraspora sp. A-T 1434 TaxID=2979219 RepID=UPI0021C02198|nr:hypothetical protein [Planotetraspora sp. A-T 1434]MCT9931116.1 hypothetical protein [Planotetraspora sp. A-T 1434]